MKNQIIKTVAMSILTSSFLLGVDIPNIGSIEKEIPTPIIEKDKVSIPNINIKKQYKAPMKDNGKTILVKSISFSSNDHISSNILKNLVKNYENKELTFTQITEITTIITKYYREQGYFVARAYLPVQNIKVNNNILEIAVIEGDYGEFILNNNSLVKDSVVQGMIDDAKSRDNVISTDTLERAMLIINDTSGIMVNQADIKPGKEIGSSDFIIKTEKTNRLDGYVLVDNAGGKYTGKNRLMAGLNINSPFNIGDKISLTGLVSNGADLRNGKIAYEAPLTSSGLLGGISYSKTTYNLVKLPSTSDDLYTGSSNTIEANLKYPVLRTRNENLYLNMNLANKELKDEFSGINLNPRKTNAITVGADYDKLHLVNNFNSSSNISLNVKYGNLSFDEEADKTTDGNGANTNGNYSKVNLDLSNIIFFTDKLSLSNSLKMQYALGNKNLDGSEDISIGGSTGVKLYPSGELSAENGYVFNIEAKYKLANVNKLSNTIGIFYDRGKAWMSNNKINFESKSLQDVGVGYYARYDNMFGQIQVAWNANSDKITSEENRNSRVLFQAGLVF